MGKTRASSGVGQGISGLLDDLSQGVLRTLRSRKPTLISVGSDQRVKLSAIRRRVSDLIGYCSSKEAEALPEPPNVVALWQIDGKKYVRSVKLLAA